MKTISIVSGAQGMLELDEFPHEAWLATRRLSAGISNSDVDALYDAARSAGAIGGKLIGARGFVPLFVAPSKQRSAREHLKTLIRVAFKFDLSGSQIIFCDREEDYAAVEKSPAAQPIRAFRELPE